MNIEQIAQEVADELAWDLDQVEKTDMSEFLRRCLSKLAEQAGDHPDAWRIRFRSPDTPDGFSTTHYHGTNAIADYRQIDPSAVSERLYTESQLIAEQQRTAEACAKACEDEIGNTPNDQRMLAAIDCAAMIRNGEWREYYL